MIFVDTGYLIALLNPLDQLHTRAVAWSVVIREPLVMTDYVLLECINFFSLPKDRPKAHAVVNLVRTERAYRIVPAARPLLNSGLRLHAERSDKEWSLTDCISFVVMDQLGIHRALAHDRHFEQAGFTSLLQRDP